MAAVDNSWPASRGFILQFHTQDLEMSLVVDMVRRGRIALPQFQRGFVWSTTKVAELLESVAKGWPIGALLLIKGPQPFRLREFTGLELPSRDEVELLLLDGQQRVTSVYQAITDQAKGTYYVDFEELRKHQEVIVRWSRKGSKSLTDSEISIAAIADDLYFDRHVANSLYRDLRDRYLSGLASNTYKFSAIVMDRDIELDALTQIFETLNRTGQRLDAFDLMVATLYPGAFDLREEWERAQFEGDGLLLQFDVEGVEILKLIALYKRDSQRDSNKEIWIRDRVSGVRQSDVLRIDADFVTAHWDDAVNQYRRAIRFGMEHFNWFDASSVPSTAMVLVLAYLLNRDADSAAMADWYWASVASQSFAQGANTQVIRDIDDARRGELGDRPKPSVEELTFAMLDRTARNRILERGLRGRAASKGVIDPVTGEPISEPVAVDVLSPGKGVRDTPVARLLFCSLKTEHTLRTQDGIGKIDHRYLDSQKFPPAWIETEPGSEELEVRAHYLAKWILL